LARGGAAFLAALALLPGCGGGGDEHAASGPCGDAAFRAQDEELYVTKTAVSNAIAGGGDPELLRTDLERAHTVLQSYLDAHQPCGAALLEVADVEQEALDSVEQALAALARGDDAVPDLRTAQGGLTAAQSRLSTSG
jgi:hypothetical protein